MKKIIKILGLVLLLGLIILSYFYPMFLILVGAIILVWIVAWITAKFQRRKQAPFLIPDEIINDLELAEKEYVDSQGRKEPHQILWNIHKQKGGVEYAEQFKRRTGQFEIPTSGSELQQSNVKSVQRANIQNGYSSRTAVNDSEVRRDKSKRHKNWEKFD